MSSPQVVIVLCFKNAKSRLQSSKWKKWEKSYGKVRDFSKTRARKLMESICTLLQDRKIKLFFLKFLSAISFEKYSTASLSLTCTLHARFHDACINVSFISFPATAIDVYFYVLGDTDIDCIVMRNTGRIKYQHLSK